MSISDLTLLCLVVPAGLMFPAWGVGSLMAAIGKVRGWNGKRAFWVSVFVYPLLMVGGYSAGWYANDILHISAAFVATYGLIITFIVFGIVFAPLINLVVRLKYPDAFKRSSTSLASANSISQGVLEKPVLPQRHDSSSPGDISQDTPESAAAASASMNLPSNAVAGSGHIFISYRRSDSADIAGRIYDRLIGRFGKIPIFKDVDSIPLGFDFKEYLDKKVGECDVLLAIMGDRWLDASDSTGKYRLEDPSDFVRIEIESALERNIPVIPLLVRGAGMPREESLPASLRKLVYRNGIPIRSDPDFHRDMDRLISSLEKYIQ